MKIGPLEIGSITRQEYEEASLRFQRKFFAPIIDAFLKDYKKPVELFSSDKARRTRKRLIIQSAVLAAMHLIIALYMFILLMLSDVMYMHDDMYDGIINVVVTTVIILMYNYFVPTLMIKVLYGIIKRDTQLVISELTGGL